MKDLTKDHILYACNCLLREVPFENITVSMIIKRSGVSKSTFYRYFLDKYDVMNYNYKKNLDKWLRDSNCKSWRELYRFIFQATDKDRKREKNAYSVVGTNSYSSFLYRYSYDAIEAMSKRCRSGQELSSKEKFDLSLFCYGGIAVNTDWVNGKMNDYTVEEISELIYLNMPETLRVLWSNPE